MLPDPGTERARGQLPGQRGAGTEPLAQTEGGDPRVVSGGEVARAARHVDPLTGVAAEASDGPRHGAWLARLRPPPPPLAPTKALRSGRSAPSSTAPCPPNRGASDGEGGRRRVPGGDGRGSHRPARNWARMMPVSVARGTPSGQVPRRKPAKVPRGRPAEAARRMSPGRTLVEWRGPTGLHRSSVGQVKRTGPVPGPMEAGNVGVITTVVETLPTEPVVEPAQPVVVPVQAVVEVLETAVPEWHGGSGVVAPSIMHGEASASDQVAAAPGGGLGAISSGLPVEGVSWAVVQ
ncbi:hypothetical protein PVAP13_5KG340907 [Panicum virgatum]|uniref:Uncharacterized protein n=1 Tax=Panicum virgatum TaxID=38727 RepID=A0A8T0SGN8_PANVG|nr:hypothetical protein PVAP13_5KG340907 [Panicum virgatum]